LLEDIPNDLRAKMTFVYVNDIAQVLAAALESEQGKAERAQAGTPQGENGMGRGSNKFVAQAH
jgi:nucleoside-diphosphate-sugar epimerase